MPTYANNPTEQRRILLCSTGLANYLVDVVQLGIHRFSLNRPNWKMGYLNTSSADEQKVRKALAWKPDGILILTRPSHVPLLLDQRGTPTVLVDLHHDEPRGINRITIDDREIGRRAAEYFLRHRYENMAVVTSPNNPRFSEYRADGFKEYLAGKDLKPSEFEVSYLSEQPWHHNPELDKWLQQLPKPTGMYCVNDASAQRIVEYCNRLGIRVPAEISVLGTDNNQFLCESIRPFISSIPQPLDNAGYRAASLLSEQMRLVAAGEVPEVVTEAIEPDEVVVRQSTSLREIADPAIAQAADYLRDHAVTGGTIVEAAQEAGLNRRALERGFSRHLGVTPGQFVSEVKLDHAKRLLADTDLRMWEIAEACLMTQEHFATFFRKCTGLTPSAYRRKKKLLSQKPV